MTKTEYGMGQKLLNKDDLEGYKITPKGMLQIGVKQEIPCDVLRKIIAETLEG